MSDPRWTVDDEGVLVFGPFPPPREDQPEWISIYEVINYEDEDALSVLVAAVRERDALAAKNERQAHRWDALYDRWKADADTLRQAREFAAKIRPFVNLPGRVDHAALDVMLALLSPPAPDTGTES